MTMSVVSRLNVGGAPNRPVFRPGGIVFYHSATQNLRKADLDAATDVLFCNGTLPGQATGYNAIHLGGFYCIGTSGGGGGLTGRITFVNLATAAVSTVVIPDPGPAQSFMGTVGAIGANKVCTMNSGGGFATQVWSLLPPAHAVVTAASSLTTTGALFSWQPIVEGGLPYLLTPFTANLVRASSFTTPGVNCVATAFSMPLLSGIYNPLLYQQQDATFPWNVFEYQGFFYMFGKGTTGGQEYPMITRTDISTGVTDVQILDAVTPVLATSCIMNAWLAQDFGRLYWSFGGTAFRLYGASLTQWPLTVVDTIDVDTGNNGTNSIRGLYTEPPYIYLTKTAGPTYGNQFIRVFDTELDRARRPKRRGGELWDLIPEVAPHISP
jgi:hypothetical protein